MVGMTMEFVVNREGIVAVVHSEEAQEVMQRLGAFRIDRVACVEPVKLNSQQWGWTINLLKEYRNCGKYSSRQVALNVEKGLVEEWLRNC